MSDDTIRRFAKPMLFAAALIWGTSFFVMKNTLDLIPVCCLLAVRFLGAAVLLSIIFWKKLRLLSPAALGQGALIGAFLCSAYITQTFGLVGTTPSKNAFLTSIYCVLVPFFTWAVSGRRPDRYNLLAALLCVAGVGLVSLNGPIGFSYGDGLTLLCTPLYAAHLVFVSHFSRKTDIYLLTILQFAFAGLYAAAVSALFEPFSLPALLTPEVLLPLIYLCVLVTTVAFLFQNVGQHWTDPSSAAILLSLESVFGVICSVLFYGDQVTAQMLLGFALIFTAVLCSETKFSFLSIHRQKEVPI